MRPYSERADSVVPPFGAHVTQPRFVFDCSKFAITALTSLFDFMWPTAEAQHHLHLQLSEAVHDGKLPSDIVPRKQYARAHLEHLITSDALLSQKQILARAMLVNMFAIYEAWIDDLLTEVRYGSRIFRSSTLSTKRLTDAVQFPVARGADKPGMVEALVSLRSCRSDMMEQCFRDSLRSRRYQANSDNDLLQLLYCYRHFKEIRNAIVHRNGKANIWNINTQADYHRVGGDLSGLIGIKSACDLVCLVSDGTQIGLELRAVAAFGSVLMRLVTTWETEMACTVGGEFIIIKRFREKFLSLNGRQPPRREKLIRSLCHSAGLDAPKDYAYFERFLAERHLHVRTTH